MIPDRNSRSQLPVWSPKHAGREAAPPSTLIFFYESLIWFARVYFSIRPTVIFAIKAPTDINRPRYRAWGFTPQQHVSRWGEKTMGCWHLQTHSKPSTVVNQANVHFLHFFTSRNPHSVRISTYQIANHSVQVAFWSWSALELPLLLSYCSSSYYRLLSWAKLEVPVKWCFLITVDLVLRIETWE